MYLGSWKIDDYLTFAVNTHDPSTGAQTDADAAPAYRIYEDETDTPILTGTMALLDDANTTGFYSERVQLTAANGLEKGKCYTVRIAAAVGGVTGAVVHTFQIEAEVDAETVSATGVDADVKKWSGTSVATPDTAGYPKVTIKDGTGTRELDLDSGAVGANVTKWNGTTVGRLADRIRTV